jgi:hypothetical protein
MLLCWGGLIRCRFSFFAETETPYRVTLSGIFVPVLLYKERHGFVRADLISILHSFILNAFRNVLMINKILNIHSGIDILNSRRSCRTLDKWAASQPVQLSWLHPALSIAYTATGTQSQRKCVVLNVATAMGAHQPHLVVMQGSQEKESLLSIQDLPPECLALILGALEKNGDRSAASEVNLSARDVSIAAQCCDMTPSFYPHQLCLGPPVT